MADPLPLCFLDGQTLPLREARISPLDRGFLFGDGVYEVIAVHGGHATRLTANLARLRRSLVELRMTNPHSDEQWTALILALIAANGGGDQYVYLQVTRGMEYGRNHAPFPDVPPTVFAFCAPLPPMNPDTLSKGVRCITAQDTRWSRCDIKSTALLANVLLRQLAVDAGAAETILLRQGWLTDASASAVHVVVDGEIRTPPRSNLLLPGTTRSQVEELAAAHGMACRNVPISETGLRGADEIWLSAATRGIVPVTRLDDRPVGDGRPGPVFMRMRALLEASWST